MVDNPGGVLRQRPYLDVEACLRSYAQVHLLTDPRYGSAEDSSYGEELARKSGLVLATATATSVAQ